ncbi:XRN 5'-3' exonuclease N-terminus-domain-containing protein [Dichotomocladium elegans]|nr:XRN 5'-3' exonuclease N-terminus-domain-containing protein [Dichotomocladium elegans]
MGVPAFFRWLSDKFPKVVSQVIEEKQRQVGGDMIPVDTTKPNPNGEEFDNLYLDMNGIIHPCCHPENKPAPDTEDDMMIEIFEYLDRIVDIIRPRQVLYMAIDGVAPRAKMNQQRARRFRAAQLAEVERKAAEKVEEELRAIGQEHQLPEKKTHFDSNCITPGTPFMAHLATCLRYHIAQKQNNDPLWKNLKVILSDATVPGEGEHKIMEYIRVQRALPDHNPNTSHVIYGLDADLIMLALGTHEPHFKVLREDVFFDDKKGACRVCQKQGHHANQCRATPQEITAIQEAKKADAANPKPYVFLHVNVLREYLEHALKFTIPGIPWNLERAIDDWVFMCFFVGNDFLPHLPSLEIREGAISTLSLLWKQIMPMMGGYMTNNGDVDLKRVQCLVTELGKMEDRIFTERREKEERRARNAKRRKLDDHARRNRDSQKPQGYDFAALTAAPVVNYDTTGISNSVVVENRAALRTENFSAAQSLKAMLMVADTGSSSINDSSEDQKQPRGTKRAAEDEANADEGDDATDDNVEDGPDTVEEMDLEAAGRSILEKAAADKKAKEDAAREREPDDAVRLWEEGWKERYYRIKFGFELSDTEAIRNVVKSYCEGLVWVFKYYYLGCASWSWYYPYYYAPMASDFVDIEKFDIKFEKSAPLRPFEQLMGVLPAASRDHIPRPFHALMLEESSPIIDYYPLDFEVDMDGKKWEWQGVVKLPFIETSRLLNAMDTVYDQLNEEEKIRNSEGNSILFVEEQHRLYDSIATLYTKRAGESQMNIDPKLSAGLTGTVSKDPECIPRSTLRSPLPKHDLPDIANDRSISVFYFLPSLPDTFKFTTALLRGVKLGKVTLSYEDLQTATFENINNGRRGNQNYGNNRGWVPQIEHLQEYRDFNAGRQRNRNYYDHNQGQQYDPYEQQYQRGGSNSGGYSGDYNNRNYQGSSDYYGGSNYQQQSYYGNRQQQQQYYGDQSQYHNNQQSHQTSNQYGYGRNGGRQYQRQYQYQQHGYHQQNRYGGQYDHYGRR